MSRVLVSISTVSWSKSFNCWVAVLRHLHLSQYPPPPATVKYIDYIENRKAAHGVCALHYRGVSTHSIIGVCPHTAS